MRSVVKCLLALITIGMISIIVFLLSKWPPQKEIWSSIAGALAVLAAALSVWPALRILEIQEDALRPNPTPYFDLTSRYQLLQLRVKNLGSGTAHDVRIKWDKRPHKTDGEEITTLDKIVMLLPQQSVAVLVGTTHQCFQNSTDTSFSGVAECKDAAGKIWSTHFSFSLDEHRKSLIYDDEMPRTLHDVQEIPNQLTKIAAAIREAAKELKEA